MPVLTSRIAYKELNDSGSSRIQKNVIMSAIISHCDLDNYDGKGMSLREICLLTEYEINAVSGRVNDLKKEGRLETIEKRRCTVNKKSLIAPVIPRMNVLEQEEEGKLKLLLGMRAYKDIEFKYGNGGEYRYFVYGNWKQVFPKDLDYCQINSNIQLEEIDFYDDDRGRLYHYKITLNL